MADGIMVDLESALILIEWGVELFFIDIPAFGIRKAGEGLDWLYNAVEGIAGGAQRGKNDSNGGVPSG